MSASQLLHILVGEELLRRLDDYRFRRRFASRAAAARWLIEWALRHDPEPDGKEQEKIRG